MSHKYTDPQIHASSVNHREYQDEDDLIVAPDRQRNNTNTI